LSKIGKDWGKVARMIDDAYSVDLADPLLRRETLVLTVTVISRSLGLI
jgi:hypothetical protein